MRRKLTEFGQLVDEKFHVWYRLAAALLGLYFVAVTIWRYTTVRPGVFGPGSWITESVVVSSMFFGVFILGHRHFRPWISTNAIGLMIGLVSILNAAWVQAMANYPAMTVNWIFLVVVSALLTKSWWHWALLQVLNLGLWMVFSFTFHPGIVPFQHWVFSIISALLIGTLTNLCLTWVFKEAEQLWMQTHVLARQRAILLKGLREQSKNARVMGGLIPICAHCKKIRNDQGYWNQVEAFLHENTEAKLTHGICPICAEKWKKGE